MLKPQLSGRPDWLQLSHFLTSSPHQQLNYSRSAVVREFPPKQESNVTGGLPTILSQ
jgi:hypothetical protein